MPATDEPVYVNVNGSHAHCRSACAGDVENTEVISVGEAADLGYDPCGRCFTLDQQYSFRRLVERLG